MRLAENLMATEIERKFLLASNLGKQATEGDAGAGLLSSDASSSVRVRVKGDKAWLNIKGATTELRVRNVVRDPIVGRTGDPRSWFEAFR